jgi:hypothetical protein
MQWYNEPTAWTHEGDRIAITTDAETDFWRKTHYGFIRDNGHFYYETVTGDFTAEVKFSGAYATLYDQGGLMVRADESAWVKCGVEFVEDVQYISAVVTRDYSDWSVLPLNNPPEWVWLRLKRMGGTVEIFFSVDGEHYMMYRTAQVSEANPLQVGVMCCSPGEAGFAMVFEGFRVTPA